MPRRLMVLALAAAVLASGCATGDRPSFGSDVATTALGGAAGSPVGDAAVDTVLALLERPADQDFTATYQIVRRLGDVRAEGVVARAGDTTSVTVGDTRFLTDGGGRTCTVSTGECADGILEQRISDAGVSSAFWAAAPARALRVAYARRMAAPTPASQQVAGQTAQCVDVPVGPGTERYCATELGTVAVWSTADKQIELVSISPTADPAAFSAGTGATTP